MSVRLHIERLVLEGVPVSHGAGPHVQAAVEAELARLIAVRGVSPALGAARVEPAIRGGDIKVSGGGDHGDLGRQIAGAVYRGIGGIGPIGGKG